MTTKQQYRRAKAVSTQALREMLPRAKWFNRYRAGYRAYIFSLPLF